MSTQEDEHPAAKSHDCELVPTEEFHRAHATTQAKGDEEEGQAQPHAVEEGQQRTLGDARLGSRAHGKHRCKRGADAGCPAQPKGHAQDGSPPETGRWFAMDLGFTLHEGKAAHEHNTHEDDDHPEDLGNPGSLKSHPVRKLGKDASGEHEDGREPQDKQADAGDHAAALLVGQVSPGKSRDVAQITGNQWQYAGGKEG